MIRYRYYSLCAPAMHDRGAASRARADARTGVHQLPTRLAWIGWLRHCTIAFRSNLAELERAFRATITTTCYNLRLPNANKHIYSFTWHFITPNSFEKSNICLILSLICVKISALNQSSGRALICIVWSNIRRTFRNELLNLVNALDQHVYICKMCV